MNSETVVATEQSEPRYFGDYEVIRSIGKGKFAVVYRVKKIGSDENVALKRISVDAMDEKTREKCLKEVRLLSRLDHPNIIRCIDSFILENDLIIISEWAAAGDLKRQLRKAQERGVGFDERIVWKYFSQICDAIQHMHEKRVMHRDLKPANIFLTLDGTIKVGDLGLSRELSEHTIQAHSKVGTPLYMSPEVLKGDGYDFKSDIWSLGCLLYELAMLKSPFKAEGLNMFSLFQKISNGEYQQLPDNYSEQLRSLAYSMISTRPEDRPQIGVVCDVARRLRAETNDRSIRQRKVLVTEHPQQANNSHDHTTLVSVVESKTPEIVQLSVPTRDDTDFDTKPTTATNSAIRPVSNQVRQSSKPSSAASTGRSERPYVGTVDAAAAGGGSFCEGDEEATSDWARAKVEPRTVATSSRQNSALERQQNSREVSNGMQRKEKDDKDIESEANWKLPGPLHSQPVAGSYSSHHAPTATAEQPRGSSANQSMYRRPKSGHSTENTRGFQSARRPSSQLAATSPPDKKDGLVLGAHLADASSAFAVMDALHDRLLLLGYSAATDGFDQDDDDDDFPSSTARNRSTQQLLPFHFACDLQLFSGMAGKGDNVQFFQFRRAVCVALWLAAKINVAALTAIASQIDRTIDAPMISAKRLLLLGQAAAAHFPSVSSVVSAQDIAAISASAIVTGHGIGVCNLLCFLADCALAATGFSLRQCVYQDVIGSPVGGGGDFEEDVVEESGGSFGELGGQEGEQQADERWAESSAERTFVPSGVQSSAIDPVEWRAETERVSKQLGGRVSASYGGASEWSQHLLTMKGYTSAPEQQSSVGDLSSALSNLKQQLNAQLGSLRTSETVITSAERFGPMVQEFSSKQQEQEVMETRLATCHNRIELATNELAVVEDAQEQLRETLNLRTGGDETGDSGGGTRIVALKAACQKLRQELKEVGISSALSGSVLMAVRAAEVRNHQRQSDVQMRSRTARVGMGQKSSHEPSILDE